VVSRTIYPEIPQRVDYTLTERGRALLPVLEGMISWSVAHIYTAPQEAKGAA